MTWLKNFEKSRAIYLTNKIMNSPKMHSLNSSLKHQLILLFILAAFSFKLPAEQPNIIIFLADDFGYGCTNPYGDNEAFVKTPGINRLAEEGRLFTDANTPGSVCSPTRYALLTGQYAWRGNLKYGVLDPPEGALLIEEDLTTLPDFLQQNGYRTAHIGKWHLGYTNMENVEDLSAQPLVPGPRSLGFDYHFGVPNNIDWLPKVYVENEGIWGLRSKGKHPYGKSSYGNRPYHGYDAPQRVSTEVMEDLNNRAREWIFQTVREDPLQPFFLYFAAVAVHNPISPGEKLRGSSNCGPYGDFIHDLDHSVGEILDALSYAGVLDNTLVIFTSDNGGDIGRNEVIREFNLPVYHFEEVQAREAGLKNNGDFRGDKHTIWEGGFRVPFVVRWPGHVKAGAVSDRMINLVDIFSTIQELVSGEVLPPEEAGADSFSFYDEITGNRTEIAMRPHMVVNNVQGVMAIRQGPWKYIEGEAAAPLSEGARKSHAKELHPQLYNLDNDLSETKNLIGKYPKIYKDMQATLDKIRETGSERINGKK
jgi:arylsulfatase A-like enzyme